MKNLLKLGDKFNPTELLVKTDLSFMEIEKMSKSFEEKSSYKKKKKDFMFFREALFLKKINQLSSNFEVKY